MKKIILFCLISTILVGCDKRVTGTYLSGKWECKQTLYYAKWHNGRFLDYDQSYTSDAVSTFKVKNGKLIKEGNFNDYVWLMAIDWTTLNKEIVNEYDQVIIKKISFFENVLDDKFTYISENEYINKNQQNQDNSYSKTKTKYDCARIK